MSKATVRSLNATIANSENEIAYLEESLAMVKAGTMTAEREAEVKARLKPFLTVAKKTHLSLPDAIQYEIDSNRKYRDMKKASLEALREKNRMARQAAQLPIA